MGNADHSTPRPVPVRRPARWRWLWPALICAVVVLGFTVSTLTALALLRPAPPRAHSIHMATNTVPMRVYLAEAIQKEGRRRNLDVVLTARQYGTLEALDEIDTRNEIQFALVPGGVRARDYPRVRLVATLTTEPLHVFVRPELAAKGLAGLRGKRIAVGPPSMASHHVAREVLAFVGLKPVAGTSAGDYTIDPAEADDLHAELQRIAALGAADRAAPLRALPDAVFFFAPSPSLLARQLAQTAGYHLLPVPFAEAFCQERLNPPNADGVQVDRALLTQTVIPAYTYGSDPAVPPQPCTTVGAPLRLVARDDANPDAVVRLLETLYDSQLRNEIRPLPLENQVSTFPLHAGTERYLSRNEPLLKPEHASKVGALLGGIGTLITGLIAVYSFLRLRTLRRFEAYYREIARIEFLARGLEVDPHAPSDPHALRVYLEDRLIALKHDVVTDFAEGGLQGEGLMAGIIALINDTRESVVGLTAAGTRPTPDAAPDQPALSGETHGVQAEFRAF